MSDWKITGKSKSDYVPDVLMELVTLGAARRPNNYQVTNERTGEVKCYTADNERQLGEAIAKGKLRG